MSQHKTIEDDNNDDDNDDNDDLLCVVSLLNNNNHNKRVLKHSSFKDYHIMKSVIVTELFSSLLQKASVTVSNLLFR